MEDKDLQGRLENIWANEYMGLLPEWVRNRSFFYFNNIKSDLLITGINPSFGAGDCSDIHHVETSFCLQDSKHNNYWSPLRKMLCNDGIDLRKNTAYLDLFYFREQHQYVLKEDILSSVGGVPFLADQLNLTMHLMEEVVRPKLILVKNKESWAYWGKLYGEKGWVWMGYQFEFVENLYCGALYRITGLLDSSERVAPEIIHSNLVGTYVLFSQHINQYTAIDKRPTAETLKALLDRVKD